jgi:hypothetical protein
VSRNRSFFNTDKIVVVSLDDADRYFCLAHGSRDCGFWGSF